MSELRIEVPTGRSSMAELRPAIDAALQNDFAGGLLQGKWDGDVLRLSGPGAEGTLTYEAGWLIGRADLRAPASLLRPLIEQKMSSALAKIAAS